MSGFWIVLKYTPISILIGVPACIFITYALSVIYDHVAPHLPYVSDTGTLPPESCYFGFFLSTYAFIFICAAYVRYRHVSELLKLNPTTKVSRRCNEAAFSIAVFSAVGLNIVACFQETNEFVIHFVGAIMCFFGGTAYLILQTIFTHKLTPEAKALLYARAFFTALNISCTVITFAPLHNAMVEFKGDNVLKWTAEDGGFVLHLISTYSEWGLIFAFIFFLFTLHWDFKKFDLEPPAVIFKNSDQAPDRRTQVDRSKQKANQTQTTANV